ncbi:MAG: methyltransferase domain-containing protein [Desulfobacteraceae bacterium]|jgi:sarcosine/dimethylglycine N-methyltransferase|nr:methyltransferase domain-containing protein [Desulfobacteraceae bacterium]
MTKNIAVDTTKQYYDSNDADNFYFEIWGGEDIHIGIYKDNKETIFDASRRTVQEMASRLKTLDASSKVLDIGSGYGGAARFLAKNYKCHVTALNLSSVENERNRKMTKEQELASLIKVVDGNFESIPVEDASFDFVWSQDAILHSSDREKVCEEVARVLKPGGEFIFTDPMQADNCPSDKLQPIYDRIHLESLGTPGFYRDTFNKLGMKELCYEDHLKQLSTHYFRVLKETEKQEDILKEKVSSDYIANMKKGLQHWVDGSEKGYLAWGIFHFVKPGPKKKDK